MTTPQDLGAWLKDLVHRIRRAGDLTVLTHVTTRVALLVQGQPIEHVDVSGTQSLYAVTGRVAVFTTGLLAVVDLTNVHRQVTSHSPMASPEGDVAVSVVPRSSLRRMSIDPAEGDKNYNGAWMDSEPTWPHYGQLRLTYPDLADDVILGAPNPRWGDEVSDLDGFLPALVSDLLAV